MDKNENGAVYEREINLVEYAFVLLKRWWIILIAAVLCGGAMFAYTEFAVTPMYRSTAKLYILPIDEKVSSSTAQLGLTLITDYQEMVKGRTVLERVSDNISTISVAQLSDSISCYSPEESRIIEVSFTHSDPVMAQRVADSICEEAKTVLNDVVGEDMVRIWENANLPVSPYSPSMTKNVFLGALCGAFVVCAVLFLIVVIDDKIKNPTDVENHLGLSVLGIIPEQVSKKTLKSSKSGTVEKLPNH